MEYYWGCAAVEPTRGEAFQLELLRLDARCFQASLGYGHKLANDGHEIRAVQHCPGHRNIQYTAKYTELSADRFKEFWKD